MFFFLALLACDPGTGTVGVEPVPIGACVEPVDGWAQAATTYFEATVTDVTSTAPEAACSYSRDLGQSGFGGETWLYLTELDGSQWHLGFGVPGADLEYLIDSSVVVDFEFQDNGDHSNATGHVVISSEDLWVAWIGAAFESSELSPPAGVAVDVGDHIPGADLGGGQFVYHETVLSMSSSDATVGVGETVELGGAAFTVGEHLVNTKPRRGSMSHSAFVSVGAWR